MVSYMEHTVLVHLQSYHNYFYYQISEVILEKGTAVIASYKRQQESTSSQGRIAGMDMSLILL